MELTDAYLLILLKRVSEGDERALRELYVSFSKMVRGFAKAVLRQGGVYDDGLADQAVQETFFAVWKQPNAFRGTSVSAFEAFLRGIGWHKCQDVFRSPDVKRRKSHDGSKGDLEQPEPTEDLPEEEALEAVPMCLKVLSEAKTNQGRKTDDLVAFEWWLQGLSYEDIAKRMGKPLGTVKPLVNRARTDVVDCVRTKLQKSGALP